MNIPKTKQKSANLLRKSTRKSKFDNSYLALHNEKLRLERETRNIIINIAVELDETFIYDALTNNQEFFTNFLKCLNQNNCERISLISLLAVYQKAEEGHEPEKLNSVF